MFMHRTMEIRFCFTKLFIMLIFVIVCDCKKWRTRSIHMDIVNDLVTANISARSVLPCARFCEKSLQVNHLFFSQVNQECYCSEERDAFYENTTGQEGLLGTVQWVPVKDCLEVNNLRDGVYTIEPNPGFLATVWCDMENGGWTVIQRRLDGSVDFYRNWTEYMNGFGNTSGEYWLGLDNIHYLTQEPSELHIYMETFGDTTQVDGFAHYSLFRIADSSWAYRLYISLDGYTGNVDDSLGYSNGMKFTTFDNDNDLLKENCAAFYGVGGWWMNTCFFCNLNGRYLIGQNDLNSEGVLWVNTLGSFYSLKTTVMKVRRNH